VWNDLDGDGLRDVHPTSGVFTDPGLAGWIVFADLNGNGVRDAGDPSATSAADGSYQITNLAPGSVSIVEQPTSGWRATSPVGGVHVVTLRNGERVGGVDFGNVVRNDATIGGTVFADSNRNGVRDPGEKGLPDVIVYLDLNNNAALDAGEPRIAASQDQFFTPAVDEAGAYGFTHLAAGTYHVRFVLPADLSATPAAQREQVVVLAAGQDASGVNCAAVYRANEIHGFVQHDLNGNHVKDPGEPGIAGTTPRTWASRRRLPRPTVPTHSAT
jgi:hypothetical protein